MLQCCYYSVGTLIFEFFSLNNFQETLPSGDKVLANSCLTSFVALFNFRGLKL